MTNNSDHTRDSGGCIALFLILVVIGLIVGTLISVAALVDPFSWLPSVGEIWADCGGNCDLADRFPGFWPRVGASLAYVVAAIGTLGWLMVSVADLRKARADRFAGLAQARRYGSARRAAAQPAVISAALAALPIVVALA